LCRVKIEISHLGCYQLEEIVAEKMRSLLQTQQKLIRRGWNQARARDYYDLWRILTQFQNALDRTILDELLFKKCEVRGVSFRVLDDFFTEELVSQAQKHWAATLSPFVPDLAPSDRVIHELKALLPMFFQFARESSA
jgi:predicted nucleotidyltransferase component of viral defense system